MSINKAQPVSFVDVWNSHPLLRYYQMASPHYSRVSWADTFVNPAFVIKRGKSERQGCVPQQYERCNYSHMLGLLTNQASVPVVGSSGSGKTTLFYWLISGLIYFSDNLIKLNAGYGFRNGECVPFYIPVTELPTDEITDWDSLWRTYKSVYRDQLGETLVSDEATVNQIFESGQAMFVIDGLDDIVEPLVRETLDRAIQEGLSRYPLCKSILSFQMDVNDSWLAYSNDAGIATVYLMPFDSKQINEFIADYCHKGFDQSLQQNLQEVMKDALNRGGDFPSLCETPFLLNMLCHTYSRPERPRHYALQGKLPVNQTKLFQDMSEIYLVEAIQERNRKYPDEKFHYDYIDLQGWLGRIALKIQDARLDKPGHKPLIRRDEIDDLLWEDIMHEGVSGEYADREIDIILECLARFVSEDGNSVDGELQYSFTHVSLLDHFAALGLKLEAELDQRELVKRQSAVGHESWENCWASFFEQIESRKLITRYVDLLGCSDNQKMLELSGMEDSDGESFQQSLG